MVTEENFFRKSFCFPISSTCQIPSQSLWRHA